MKSPWIQRFAFLALGVALGFLVFGPRGQGESSSEDQDRTELLATVGGTELTRGEVEGVQGADFRRMRQEMYDLTSQALERAIQVQLLELESDSQGLEPDSLIALEVDAKIDEPTDQTISDFYNSRRLQGSLEELTPEITTYLRNQARSARFAVYVQELEEKYDTERFLDPPRTTVATEDSPSKGPDDAPVTIVEFSDFQCPYCRLLQEPLKQVEAEYGDDVQFVFRQFPLASIHPNAIKAGVASLCAHDQGKFWEMHGALFQNQQALGEEQLKETAATLGMDPEEFNECLDEGRFEEEVAEDLAAGQAAGVRGTPMIFINGRPLSGLKTFDEIAQVIDDELRRARRE